MQEVPIQHRSETGIYTRYTQYTDIKWVCLGLKFVGVSFIVQSIFFEYIKSTKMIISIVSEKKTNLLHIFGWDCAYNIGIYGHV